MKIKIINLYGIILCCVIFGCNKDESITIEEQALNLISPSGEMISQNIQSLKKESSAIINDVFETIKEFEITDIEYLPVNKGYVAIVKYKTSDGIYGNYAISCGTHVNFNSNQVRMITGSSPKLKNNNENSGKKPVYTFVCHANGSCNTCSLEGDLDPENNQATVTCSCNDCILETKIRYE
ncbi:MAG: hypothetical protein LBQ60_15040 [Bacteroidales bacterium]|nr:hypothetical protein [Bacteroidales bacterium]